MCDYRNSATLIAICSLIASLPLAAQDELRLFEADDVFQLEYASDPRISPDGSTIVYERRANDIMTDSTRSNLWQISIGRRTTSPAGIRCGAGVVAALVSQCRSPGLSAVGG